MAESPPKTGEIPPKGDPADEPLMKKGDSDPLFNPPMLKTRKTAMGLAPAPHLGGANTASSDAEARKQRVLARIAGLDTKPPPKTPSTAPTTPPRPGSQAPAAAATRPPTTSGGPPRVHLSSRPPPKKPDSVEPQAIIAIGSPPVPKDMAPKAASPATEIEGVLEPPAAKRLPREAVTTTPLGGAGYVPAPQVSAAVGRPSAGPPVAAAAAVGRPSAGPPAEKPAFLSSTAIMEPRPQNEAPTNVISEPRMPSPSGWDISEDPRPVQNAAAAKPAEVERAPSIETEVVDAAPITARMLPTAKPVDQPMVPGAAQPPAQASTAPVPTTTALSIRPWEPTQLPQLHEATTGLLDERLVLITEPNSQRAASFRVLRDSLMAKSMPRVVAVSSPAPNEGKTTCAINLALAISEQSNRVLLVDGNFFEPEIGAIFAIHRLPPMNPPDAAAWLSPYQLVAVRPTLHVAAIPQTPGMLPVRFDQARFEGLIDRFIRVSYDYIIMDTPALRGTPAVLQLMAIADGTLLAVRAGGTTTRDLRRAAEQIPKNKALGIALIDA